MTEVAPDPFDNVRMDFDDVRMDSEDEAKRVAGLA